MGNNLCCEATDATKRRFPNSLEAELRLQMFFEDFPQVKQSYDQKTERESFGIVDKTYLLEYSYGLYIGRSTEDLKRIGAGIMLFGTGMLFVGEWNKDIISGKGLFIFTNGDCYNGQWKNNLPHGYGTYTCKKENWKYTGNWIRGKQQGKGKETFDDGSFYDGQFKQGLRNGKGKYQHSDGRHYQGYFKNNQYSGSGIGYDFDYIYDGQWEKDKQNGTGKSQWFDRAKQTVDALYVGQYKDGEKDGFGEYRMKEVSYQGKWNQGEMTNQGVLVHSEKNDIQM